MDHPIYAEILLLDKIYRSNEYFFDDGKNHIELIELKITATQLTQLEAQSPERRQAAIKFHPGQTAVDGTIKVPIVFSAWFNNGDPFDIYIRNAKSKELELRIMDVVFTSYGPDYITYAARGYIHGTRTKQ